MDAHRVASRWGSRPLPPPRVPAVEGYRRDPPLLRKPYAVRHQSPRAQAITSQTTAATARTTAPAIVCPTRRASRSYQRPRRAIIVCGSSKDDREVSDQPRLRAEHKEIGGLPRHSFSLRDLVRPSILVTAVLRHSFVAERDRPLDQAVRNRPEPAAVLPSHRDPTTRRSKGYGGGRTSSLTWRCVSPYRCCWRRFGRRG
jgi:hypothetical protein